MEYSTWLTLKTQILNDQDLEDGDFMDSTELLGIANRAINEAEAEIHNLYEDYFLTTANIDITSGTASYALPSNIFGNKIRLIQYDDGSTSYEVKRIPIRSIVDVETGDDYQYALLNASATAGVTINLYPTPDFNDKSGSYQSPRRFTVYYLRNAETLTGDSSKIDIPEFGDFVYIYLKVAILEKQEGTLPQSVLQMARMDLERQRGLMKATLENMVPDDDVGRIEIDSSFYDEHE